MTPPRHSAVAILPSRDLDASLAFYERLGFRLVSDYPHQGYRILEDAAGASLHLTRVGPAGAAPEDNPFGVYLYTEHVRALAEAMGARCEPKPWGLIEFAVSDPDGTLVRVGWPIT